MVLRKPKSEDESLLKDYMLEHYNNGEYIIHGANLLEEMDYRSWIEKLKKDEVGTDILWGISDTYILVDNDKVLGIINIRYNPSNELVSKYGHIGYGVRPTERRKGIATYLLKEALVKCKEKGLSEVILGCYKNNVGSSRVIIKNGGYLYREDSSSLNVSQYYKIKLK